MYKKILAFFRPKGMIADNAVETRINIIEAIIATLKPLRYKINNFQALNLYFNQQECANPLAILSIVTDKDFELLLRSKLENANIILGDECKWRYVESKAPEGATMIGNGLYISTSIAEAGYKKGSIVALKGKMEENKYILEAQESIKYNIGRGKFPELENRSFHENHIVIKDPEEFNDKQDKNIELNKYVSRAHAVIEYSNQAGFLLKVLPGGSPAMKGSRTIIKRENYDIELKNIHTAEPLKDKDQIELSKSVLLLFRISADEITVNSFASQVVGETLPSFIEKKVEATKDISTITTDESTHIENAGESLKGQNEKIVSIFEGLLYDYCIIDTNIWMETTKTRLYHGRINTLKILYQKENKKLVAHGSTYEELKKFGESGIRNAKGEAASSALQMIKSFNREKMILIPDLKAEHDIKAYADKDIYNFATEEYSKGKSILLITNDEDLNLRVTSSLSGLKKNNSALKKFEVSSMEQIAGLIDKVYIYYTKGK